MRKFLTLLLTCFFLLASAAMAQDDPMKGPWEGPEQVDTGCHRPNDLSRLSDLSVRALKFFREYVSPVDGSDCPMLPSCSRYSVRCVEKYGFWVGLTMTWDRLYRCGRNELDLSPWILTDEESRCYDPVENNDFWWHKE